MPVERRERPRCRREIERLLREKNCTLQDLIAGENKYGLGDDMRIQVRKMIEEQSNKLKVGR